MINLLIDKQANGLTNKIDCRKKYNFYKKKSFNGIKLFLYIVNPI